MAAFLTRPHPVSTLHALKDLVKFTYVRLPYMRLIHQTIKSLMVKPPGHRSQQLNPRPASAPPLGHAELCAVFCRHLSNVAGLRSARSFQQLPGRIATVSRAKKFYNIVAATPTHTHTQIQLLICVCMCVLYKSWSVF